MGLLATPAVLLRSHPYSETSRILRFYTRDAGLVGTMARGIRSRGSKGRGGVESLAVGTLTAYVKSGRDLQTFRDFAVEPTPPSAGRGPIALACGSILAEIVLRHAGADSNPDLFDALVDGLRAVARESEPLPVTLTRAWTLVAALGYQPELDGCVACGRSLDGEAEAMRFDHSAGGLRCPDCSAGVVGPRLTPETRRDLVAMIEGTSPAASLSRPRAHLALLDDFVTYHLSAGESMRSVGVLRDLMEAGRG